MVLCICVHRGAPSGVVMAVVLFWEWQKYCPTSPYEVRNVFESVVFRLPRKPTTNTHAPVVLRNEETLDAVEEVHLFDALNRTTTAQQSRRPHAMRQIAGVRQSSHRSHPLSSSSSSSLQSPEPTSLFNTFEDTLANVASSLVHPLYASRSDEGLFGVADGEDVARTSTRTDDGSYKFDAYEFEYDEDDEELP